MRARNLMFAGLLGSAAAFAAPPIAQYCVVVTGMSPSCRYVDEADCAQAAAKVNGGCVDRNGVGTAHSFEPKDAGYCLVGHGDSKCYFYSAQACASEAKIQGGTCVTKPSLSSATH